MTTTAATGANAVTIGSYSCRGVDVAVVLVGGGVGGGGGIVVAAIDVGGIGGGSIVVDSIAAAVVVPVNTAPVVDVVVAVFVVDVAAVVVDLVAVVAVTDAAAPIVVDVAVPSGAVVAAVAVDVVFAAATAAAVVVAAPVDCRGERLSRFHLGLPPVLSVLVREESVHGGCPVQTHPPRIRLGGRGPGKVQEAKQKDKVNERVEGGGSFVASPSDSTNDYASHSRQNTAPTLIRSLQHLGVPLFLFGGRGVLEK